MSRELASFAIPPSLRTKLTRAGFRTVSDLADVKALELAKGFTFVRVLNII